MSYRDTIVSNKSLSIVDTEGFVMQPGMLEQAHLVSGITKPHPHDVLCGRGNSVNKHPGNQYFRSLVKHLKNEYVMSEKSDKPMFAKYILKHICLLDPPGRFLRKNKSFEVKNPKPATEKNQDLPKEKEELYEVIAPKLAKEKIRQALREDTDQVKKEIENGKRRVTTSVCMGINSYSYDGAPTSLQSIDSSTTTHSTTTTGLNENRLSYHSSTSMGNDFRMSANRQIVNNFNPCLNNPPRQYTRVPISNQISISNQSMTSSVLSQPARSRDVSINSSMLNQSVNTNPQSYNQQMNGINQSYVSNGGYYYNPSMFYPFLPTNSNVGQQFAPSLPQDSNSTINHQVPLSTANNVSSSMGTALRTNMNGSMPLPIDCVPTKPTICSSQRSVETVEDNNNSISSNVHFEEQKYMNTEADKNTEDDGLEEFPGGMTNNNDDNDDGLEDFPGATTNNHHNNSEKDDNFKEGFLKDNKIGGNNKFAPVSFRASENGQRSFHSTDNFTSKGTGKYKSCETYEVKRHSLYLPGFDRRSKIERRRSAMIIANFLQKLEDVSDDSDEDDYEVERERNTKRKLNDIGKLRASLRGSLRIDDVFTHDRKKADRRRSQRASLVLRQSLLKSLANPAAKEKSSSKNVEKIYLPHLSHTKIERRRSTITECSSELLKVFGSEHKAIPRKSVKEILPDVLDPVSTDTLIESVLISGSSIIDDNMLKMLRELDDEDEDEEWQPTPLNSCGVNVNISSGVTKLNLETGE